MFSVNDIDQLKTHMRGARGPEFRYNPPKILPQDVMDESDKNEFGPHMVKRIRLRRVVFELYTSSIPRKLPMSESEFYIHNASGPFQYEHLRPSTRAIRLLQVNLPSDTSYVQQWGMSWETPSCRMETFESSPGHFSQPYVALSYAWGDLQAPKECIKLNGHKFEVTKTLFDFLCFFRNSLVNEETRPWIWIDQICINQLDNDERSHTVSFMADIYREATFVVAWLGYDIWSTHNAQRHGPMPRDFVLLLQPILDNPYFTRLWIVQEVLLAREVHFICGHIWLPLPDIKKCCEYRASGIDPNVTTPSLDLLWKKDSQRLHLEWNPNHQHHIDLQSSINAYCGNACQDPRDKVYALMSFVKAEDQVSIDYSKTVEQVFRDAFLILERGWSQYPKERSLGSSLWHVLRLAKFMLLQSQYIVFVKMLKARFCDRVQYDSYLYEVLYEFSGIESVPAIEQG